MKYINLLISAWCLVLVLSGCHTYFGYETIQEKKDVEGSVKKVSSELQGYQIKIIDDKIEIKADYKDYFEKDVEACEVREHIYLHDGQVLKYIFPIPLRAPFDIFACLTKWNLASNPPSFAQRLFYTPPFCWFAIFSCPPYWLDNPNSLPEGKTVKDTYTTKDGKEHEIAVTKTIEREKSKLRREKISYAEKSSHQITENAGVQTDLAKIQISIAGKKFDLDPLKPIITRAMLPQDFISIPEPIIMPIPPSDEDFKKASAIMPNFKVAESVSVTVEYKGKVEQLSVATSQFMTAEELWSCGWFYFWKRDIPKYALYLQLAAEKGHPSALFLMAGSYLKGDTATGIEQDQARGFRYLKKAADAGQKDAALKLASLLKAIKDSDAKKNYQKIAEAQGSAADAEQKNAALLLLNFLKETNDSDIDKYYQIAADQGSSEAQFRTGMSRFANQDIEGAMKYLKMAAEQNNVPAQYLLGKIYFAEELGAVALLIQNIPEAEKWMRKAAEKKLPAAEKELSVITNRLNQYNQQLALRQKAEQEFGYYSQHSDQVISSVKNMVFPVDDTRTLEEALKVQFDQLRWRKFRSSENQTVVEVVGIWKSEKFKPNYRSLKDIRSLLQGGGKNIIIALLPQKGEEVMLQFVITKMGEARFHYAEIRDPNGVLKNCVSSQKGILPAYTDPRELYLKKDGVLEMVYGKD